MGRGRETQRRQARCGLRDEGEGVKGGRHVPSKKTLTNPPVLPREQEEARGHRACVVTETVVCGLWGVWWV